jgi:hypothetical protein
VRIYFDVELFRQSAETRNILDTWHRANLFFKNPVLDGLLVGQIVVGALNRVAVNFADRIVGRDSRRHALRQSNEREPVDCFDAVPVVVAVPRKIAANVRKAVE